MHTIKETEKLDPQALKARFRHLDAIWRKETAYQSSSTRIKNHPAFQEVVSLGAAMLPLLLRDLQAGPSLWVWALPEITGEDPVAPEDRGNIAKMSEAWLDWGARKGITW